MLLGTPTDAATLAVGTTYLTFDRLSPGDPLERQPLALNITDIKSFRDDTVLLAPLPAEVRLGLQTISYESACGATDAPPRKIAQQGVEITAAATLPTTLGTAALVPYGTSVIKPTGDDPDSVPDRGIRVGVKLSTSGELAKFAYVAHIKATIEPADRVRGGFADQVVGIDLDASGAAFLSLGATCITEGPVRVHLTGGVHGLPDLPAVDIDAGTCTADDVAAGKANADGAEESGCSIGRSKTHTPLGIGLVAAAAVVGLFRRRRVTAH